MRPEKARSTARRSNRLVTAAVKRLATRATSEVAVTAWPAAPSVTLRSDAIGVRSTAGSISATMTQTTPSERESTARPLRAVRYPCGRIDGEGVSCKLHVHLTKNWYRVGLPKAVYFAFHFRWSRKKAVSLSNGMRFTRS